MPNSQKKAEGLGRFSLASRVAAHQSASRFDCQLVRLLGRLIKTFFLSEPKRSAETYVSDTLDGCQLPEEIFF